MPFVIVVKTDNVGTSTDLQFTLPTSSFSTSYDYTVTRISGPGTLTGDPVTHTTNNTALTLDFSVAGTYELSITGTFRGLRFNNGSDRLKLLEIKEWGVFEQSAGVGQQFYGCSNLVVTATDTPLALNATGLSEFFRNCSSLITVADLNLWPTTGKTNLNSMFLGCTSFTGAGSNIGGMDVSSVTTLSSTFNNCTSFNQDISAWDVRNVTTWAAAFGSIVGNYVPFSSGNYNKMLTEWSKLPLQVDITVNFGVAEYDIDGPAEQSRFYLTTKVLSQACTFTADTITAEAHGLVLDNVITFTTAGTLPTGLAVATRYWVVNPTADTFQVSTTKGGAATTFTADDTPTHTVEGGYNWTISDGGGTAVVEAPTESVYIFTNSTPILDSSNNPVQNAKVVFMRYDKLETLTAGAVNQADIVMGVALTDASGNFSVNVTAFTNFAEAQDYIGMCYKDGTPILTYVPVKITPVAE